MQMKMNECCDIKVTSFEESNIVDKLEFLFFLTRFIISQFRVINISLVIQFIYEYIYIYRNIIVFFHSIRFNLIARKIKICTHTH